MDITTEKESNYKDLEKMTVNDILVNINKEDSYVTNAVAKVIPQIEALVSAATSKMKDSRFINRNT